MHCKANGGKAGSGGRTGIVVGDEHAEQGADQILPVWISVCCWLTQRLSRISPAAGDLLPEPFGLVSHTAVLLLPGLDHRGPVLLELLSWHVPQRGGKIGQEGVDPVVQVLRPMRACTDKNMLLCR